MGNTAQHCRLGLFRDSVFAGDLEDSKSTSGSPMKIRKPNICPHQLEVQEANISIPQFYRSDIISLDAGLRIDGLSFD